MAGTHPIRENPDLSLDARVRRLEHSLAQLWDQVWWLSLDVEVRRRYEEQGFTAPIEKFYDD